MSIAISTCVWANGPADQGLLLTLLALADRMDDQGVTLPRFGGVQEIAKRIRRSMRQANRNLRKLESEGWLTVERRTPALGLKGAENRYCICLKKLGACDTAMSHAGRVGDDIAMSRTETLATDTAMSHANGPAGDISSREHRTFSDVECDTAVSSHNRKNVERNYNVSALAAEIASKERTLQGEKVLPGLQQAIETEIKSGAAPAEAGSAVLSQVRRYLDARTKGRFEIHGWSVANLLAGGHWRDEQCWPWKPEHRPERKMRYRDPATLYNGPEYQRRAEGA